MKKIVLLLFCLAFLLSAIAQQSSSELLQKITRLNVLGSVLYIAAHPDDENTRLLTWLNKERQVRTGYLSLTRGDGGQNLIGKEQGEMLGLVRTQELLAARKVDGAEQFFTRANDFGYSKNPEETMSIWNKDTILSDMVWVIRNFKPDVIICRFPTNGDGGHGHHTASALLALEAYEAAADPKRFPDQLKYTSIWQVKKVFWNIFSTLLEKYTPDVKTDVGGFDPLIGKSMGEISADSRSMHKTQGFGAAKTRGKSIEYFKQLRGDSARRDLFEDIDLSWKRINADAISKIVEECIARFNVKDPSSVIPALTKLYKALQALPAKDDQAAYWKNQKLKEIEGLLINCTGLWMEATADTYFGIPGKKVEVSAQVINRSNLEIKLNSLSWAQGDDTAATVTLKPNELYTFKHVMVLPEDMPYSGPYWLNNPHKEGYYNVVDQKKIGVTENDPALRVTFDIALPEMNLKLQRPVVYKSVDPAKGEVYRPFEVLPFVTINFSSKAFMFKNGEARKIQLHVKSNTDSLNGEVKINLPEGWKAAPEVVEIDKLNKSEDRIAETTVTPPKGHSTGNISAGWISDSEKKSFSIYRADYDHIPSQFMVTDAKAKLVSFDLAQAGLHIGYIPGAGDEVAQSLAQLGYQVTILSEDVLAKKKLNEFDAIVTGIRAFNTNEWLKNYNQALLDYVKQGGNLVVQYNTNSSVGPLITKIAPYPFTISRERVTNENAEVHFVKPAHPALNFPNKISTDDFKDWIQERGIYFASDIDSSYEKIISMNDPGEKPNEGALITARYGKGNFVYTGLVFFRELPNGIPGAYRLLVNLVSLPKNN